MAEPPRQASAKPGWLYWGLTVGVTAVGLTVLDAEVQRVIWVVPLMAALMAPVLARLRNAVRLAPQAQRALLPGVGWVPLAHILAAECCDGLWLVTLADRQVLLPRGVEGVGPLVDHLRRRGQSTPAAAAPLDEAQLRHWLGIEPGARLRLRPRPPAEVMFGSRVVAFHMLAALLAVGRASWAEMLGLEAFLGMLLLVFGALSRWSRVTCDEQGLSLRNLDETRAIGWHQLEAVVDEGRCVRLVASTGDIRIDAHDSAAAAVRHTAEQVLAALAQQGGWVAEAGDASLSPAERLTGEAERGLSEAQYGGTGLPAGERAEPPTASATPSDAH